MIRYYSVIFFTMKLPFFSDSSLLLLISQYNLLVQVRTLRSECTVKMMRISWEKSTTPILWALTAFMRPHVRKLAAASDLILTMCDIQILYILNYIFNAQLFLQLCWIK
jgi:hypothetical protein